MIFSEQLSKLRKEANLTQEDLAEKCQVSRQAIAKWESGESVPTIEKFIILAGLFEMSLDELVGITVVDKYAKAKQYIKEFAAKDIPVDEDDDISAIVVRYLLFAERMGLTAEQRMTGLEEIFLCDAN
ncbi:MAG: helix-turn-helix transcriptional regulator [Lachnospiraceae bacterium]